MIQKSVTRKLRNKIENKDLRKKITKIWHVIEEDTGAEYYSVYFKEDTVKSMYDCDYISMTSAPQITGDPVRDINEWLNETAYVPEWYGEK